jgi:hypothetical protein
MFSLNHDTEIKQQVFAWYVKTDAPIIVDKLVGIANAHPELDDYLSSKFTHAEFKALSKASHIHARVFVLVNTILSLADTFLAQTALGQELRGKASTIMLSLYPEFPLFSFRTIELNDSEFATFFVSCLS